MFMTITIYLTNHNLLGMDIHEYNHNLERVAPVVLPNDIYKPSTPKDFGMKKKWNKKRK